MYLSGKGKLAVDPLMVRELINALHQIAVVEPRQFLDPGTPNLGLERPAAVLTLWQEGLEPNQANKAENAEPAYYDDTRQFRPRRNPGAHRFDAPPFG